jgi:tRNA A37 threonylcarbamoyladenosine dehydratase
MWRRRELGGRDASSLVCLKLQTLSNYPNILLTISGISSIRLIDFDYVTLSSLNRHATATLADVGTPKVSCIARTLRQISRWANIECCVEVWRKDEGGKILEGVDWVVGASPYLSCRGKN